MIHTFQVGKIVHAFIRKGRHCIVANSIHAGLCLGDRPFPSLDRILNVGQIQTNVYRDLASYSLSMLASVPIFGALNGLRFLP